MQKSGLKNILLATVIILLASVSRLVDHPWNFTPMIGIVLFGSAFFKRPALKFLIPIGFIFVTDLILELTTGQGFYKLLPIVYISYALVAIVGLVLIKKISPANVVIASLLSSSLFFVFTNFAFFYPESAETNTLLGYYPHNLSGIIASYSAGLPFFRNMVIGDLLFTGVIFSSYYLVKNLNFGFSKNNI